MKDIHQVITDRFMEQLKAGTVPWQRPWLSVQNIVSKKPYRGINSLTLGSSKFDSPYWLTFKQARDLGGTIKAGEKSSPVIYYKFTQKHDAQGQPVLNSSGRPTQIPFLRWSNVFNLRQTEGIETPVLTENVRSGAPLEKADTIVRQANLCPIHNEGFAAAYSPLWDAISMPAKARFHTDEDYYHTLFHEMTHATGHKSRLNREGIVEPVRFGSERYSKEELIAELGAAFLSNEAGILDKVRFENSAAYLNSWIGKFKEDPSLIVSAASQAQRGSDFVLGIVPHEGTEMDVTSPTVTAEEFTPPKSRMTVTTSSTKIRVG